MLRGGGSRASMSPQQRAGEPAAPADDLYALGALLFELLSGRPPFPPGSTEEEARTLAPPPVASPFPVPDALRSLVAALLARSPGDRPASATAVREKLGAIESELAGMPWAAGGAGAAHPPVRLQPPPRVAEGGVLTPSVLEERLGRMRSRPRTGLSPAQLTLLAGLGVAAVLAVLWLPRWAQPPNPAPTASSPALVPSEAPPPSPPPPVEAPPSAPARRPSPRRTRPPARRRAPGRFRRLRRGPRRRPRFRSRRPRPSPPRTGRPKPRLSRVSATRLAPSRRGKSGGKRSAAYEAALAVDPLVAFALEGKERAGSRAALQAALDFHVRQRRRASPRRRWPARPRPSWRGRAASSRPGRATARRWPLSRGRSRTLARP